MNEKAKRHLIEAIMFAFTAICSAWLTSKAIKAEEDFIVVILALLCCICGVLVVFKKMNSYYEEVDKDE